MQLKFKNGELQNIYQFLKNLKIKGANVNRARFQVVRLFETKLKEYSDARAMLITQYVKKDSTGNPIEKDGQCEVIADRRDEFNREYTTFMAEDSLLTIDDYVAKFHILYNFLTKYEEELAGTDGYTFGAFLDELERVGINHVNND